MAGACGAWRRPSTSPRARGAARSTAAPPRCSCTMECSGPGGSRSRAPRTRGPPAALRLVHHGMFGPGGRPIRGAAYERLRLLLAHDVAVYASHLPLDRHPRFGNGVLLARALGLEPTGEFGRYQSIMVGVRGETDQ